MGIGRAAEEPVDAVVDAAATAPTEARSGMRIHAGRPERLAAGGGRGIAAIAGAAATSAAVAAVGIGEGAGRAGAVGGVADGRTHGARPGALAASVAECR